MSEIGTLKELNVQPGDVVEVIESGARYVIGDPPYKTDGIVKTVTGFLFDITKARIVSRAKPAIDLTANTSAWGLCSDEWRAAMQAHVGAGGEVVCYVSDGEWHLCGMIFFANHGIYRAKPGPVVTTRVHASWLYCHGGGDSSLYRLDGLGHIPGTLTTTFHDGKPVKAEWVAE